MPDTVRVVVVHDDGSVETKEIDQRLHTMRTLVGDGEEVWVQAITTGNATFWCDEEIKYKSHSLNAKATAAVLSGLHDIGLDLMPGDYLGGTVVISGKAPPLGNMSSIPKGLEGELLG